LQYATLLNRVRVGDIKDDDENDIILKERLRYSSTMAGRTDQTGSMEHLRNLYRVIL
jgi:hypothetical protein